MKACFLLCTLLRWLRNSVDILIVLFLFIVVLTVAVTVALTLALALLIVVLVAVLVFLGTAPVVLVAAAGLTVAAFLFLALLVSARGICRRTPVLLVFVPAASRIRPSRGGGAVLPVPRGRVLDALDVQPSVAEFLPGKRQGRGLGKRRSSGVHRIDRGGSLRHAPRPRYL